jgi:hypothetical protein
VQQEIRRTPSYTAIPFCRSTCLFLGRTRVVGLPLLRSDVVSLLARFIKAIFTFLRDVDALDGNQTIRGVAINSRKCRWVWPKQKRGIQGPGA